MLEISIDPSSKNIVELNEGFLSLLHSSVKELLEEFECSDRSCSLLICDNAFIQKLNQQYRQKDYSTDVLSFAFDDDTEFVIPGSSLGDIVVSSETALSQSQEFEVTYEEEFARLTIHGILHLLGYDHELGDEEEKEMFELQDLYMQKFMQKYNGTDSALI